MTIDSKSAAGKSAVTQLRFIHDGREQSARGRDAWALAELVKAGKVGCTPITHPGPRWAAYVAKLRQRGLSIETVHETHGGAFAGRHARYVLRSPVEVLEVREAA